MSNVISTNEFINCLVGVELSPTAVWGCMSRTSSTRLHRHSVVYSYSCNRTHVLVSFQQSVRKQFRAHWQTILVCVVRCFLANCCIAQTRVMLRTMTDMSAAEKFLTPGNMKADLPVPRTVSTVWAGQGSEVEVAYGLGIGCVCCSVVSRYVL